MARRSQETEGGGEIVGRFPGAGVVVAEHAPRSGKSVLAELPRCLELTYRMQDGSEIVRDIHGEVALVAENPPRPGKSVLAELSGRRWPGPAENSRGHLRTAGASDGRRRC